MWCHLLDVYTKFKIDISKHAQKSLENFSLAGSPAKLPLHSLLSARGQKLPNHDENQ